MTFAEQQIIQKARSLIAHEQAVFGDYNTDLEMIQLLLDHDLAKTEHAADRLLTAVYDSMR